MTYNTPELLLVGAAQSLVLEGLDNSQPTGCEPRDNVIGLESDLPELW